MSKQFWLLKSEPNTYSIDDLRRDGTTCWSGVRNFQARNFMRDQMRIGDGILFYHSNVPPMGVSGFAEVVRVGYPDQTAWNPKDLHYDPKSLPDSPIWFMVDIRYVRHCRTVITLAQMKAHPALQKMVVVQRGTRLSVQPVRPNEWEVVSSLAFA